MLTASLLFSSWPQGTWDWLVFGTRLLVVVLALYFLVILFSNYENDERKIEWSWWAWTFKLGVGLVMCSVMAAAGFGWPADWPGWVLGGLRAVAAVDVVCLAVVWIRKGWREAPGYPPVWIVGLGISGVAILLLLALISGRWIYLAGLPVAYGMATFLLYLFRRRARRRDPEFRRLHAAMRGRPFSEADWMMRCQIAGRHQVELTREERKLGRSLTDPEITLRLNRLYAAEQGKGLDGLKEAPDLIPKDPEARARVERFLTIGCGPSSYNTDSARHFRFRCRGHFVLLDKERILAIFPIGIICGELRLSFPKTRLPGEPATAWLRAVCLLAAEGHPEFDYLVDAGVFLTPSCFERASSWEQTSPEMRETAASRMLARAVWMRMPDWPAPRSGMIAGQQWTLEPGEREACVTLSVAGTGDALLCKVSGLPVNPAEPQRTVPAFWFLIPLEDWLKAPWLPVSDRSVEN